jgi:tetratricopeptide (TPR) repeat protein
MGKSFLLEQFAAAAQAHPGVQCGCVQYLLTCSDTAEVVMERMLADAFGAGNVTEGAFDRTHHRRRQWLALLKTCVPRGKDIAELIESLEHDPRKPIREQFLDRLRLISNKLSATGRAVFIIDPLETLDPDCAQEWTVVARNLPEKIKLVFAQRPEDALACYRKFMHCDSVVRIPADSLGGLDPQAVQQLLDLRKDETKYKLGELAVGLKRFGDHPYALQGAIDLLVAGKTRIQDLPDDPTDEEIAKQQWEIICQAGEEAIALFGAYAVLGVPVPDAVAEDVSGVDHRKKRTLLAGNNSLEHLLREEGSTRRIYHLLLQNTILGDLSEQESKEFHTRAAQVYRQMLAEAEKQQTKPDETAVLRLPVHVLAAEGEQAFVSCFNTECEHLLRRLGYLEQYIQFSKQALEYAEKDSQEESVVYGNLGIVYKTRGQLEMAEQVLIESLRWVEKEGADEQLIAVMVNLGNVYYDRGDLDKAAEIFEKCLAAVEVSAMQEGTAAVCGNLGLIYQDQGQLDTAEQMHKRALEIDERMDNRGRMAEDYSNLGLVYFDRQQTDAAQEMFDKALEIDETMGNREGIATDYRNLGIVCEQRGDRAGARQWWKKSKALYEQIGMMHMAAEVREMMEDCGE